MCHPSQTPVLQVSCTIALIKERQVKLFLEKDNLFCVID